MKPIQLILPEVDSTQLRLKQELEANPQLSNLSYVQGLKQTQGRGRQDHRWQSPEGNFYFSVLLRGPHSNVTWMPLWVAISLRRAIETHFKLREPVFLKWPNDLMIKPFAKLSGILVEKVGDHLIVGVGVNVRVHPEVEGREIASLQKYSLMPLFPSALNLLRESFLDELARPFSIDAIRHEFEAHGLVQPGDMIEWMDSNTKVKGSGLVIGLGEHGELMVAVDGQPKKLFSEEVLQVRKFQDKI